MFIEALKKYELEHKTDHPTPQPDVDYTDPFNRAIDRILKVTNTVGYHSSKPYATGFLDDNPHLIEQWDAEIVEALEVAGG